MDDQPMTKARVRSWLKRVREDLHDAEIALVNNDLESLFLCVQDASASAATVESACLDQGIRGLGIYDNI
jgi:hypothetical protein